jgi:hypothetical protein
MTTTTLSPASANIDRADHGHMSFGAYAFIACMALALGLMALYVSREYAQANLTVLGLDKAALDVRSYSIDLLLLADIVLVFTAAMMPRIKFAKLRWKLLTLAGAIWAFDVLATYQARIGIVMQGTSIAESTDLHTSQLKASIESARATADGLRQSAAKQATSIFPASRADGAASLRAAADADRRAEAMTAQLAALSKGKAPTEESVWGRWTPWKMFAEVLLIGLVNLAMFILTGEMVRAARDIRSAPAAKPASATAPATAAPKASTLPRWSSAMPKASIPAYAAAAVPLGAMGAPLATFAPPLPTPPSISVPAVLRQDPAAVPAQVQLDIATVPTQVQQATATVPERVQSPSVPAASAAVPAAALAEVAPAAQVKTGTVKPAKAKRKARASTVAVDGNKMDSGTKGKAAGRYQRIKDAVLAGNLKPSVRSLREKETCGGVVAKRYLQQLASEGVIERKGQGWTRVTTNKAQLVLEGV